MFVTDIVITPTPDYKSWQLVQDAVYHGQADVFRIPKGFKTNFANNLPPLGRYMAAALLHDYLYSGIVSRKDADGLFYRVLREYGVSKWQAKLMYWAVRLLGKTYYVKSKTDQSGPSDLVKQ